MSDFPWMHDYGSFKNLRVLAATPRNIQVAAGIVRRGGLVVYPTDTVYGLGCDPFNVRSVKRLIQTKGSRKEPFPILISELNQIDKLAYVSPNARRIGEAFWPGPLTLILTKRALHEMVTLGGETIGVRMPNNEIALNLVALSGGFLIGTSANKTGHAPAMNATEACEQLGKCVDLILEAGTANLKRSSTVVDLTGEEPRVLRKGPISLNKILNFLKTLPKEQEE